MPSKPWSKKKPAKSIINRLLAVSGITVSPALTRLDLSVDPPQFSLGYTNTTSFPVELKFSARDFTSLEEGWRVKFMNPADSSNYRYSLSSWLEFAPPTLLLTPGQSGTVRVTVREASLSGGGHYASVIADLSTAPAVSQGLPIKSQLASLVFVRTNTGQERDRAGIAGFTASGNTFFHLPKNYQLRFDNSGNTDLTPHGLLTVTDWLGREISRGIINQDSLTTLPETIRRFDIPISVRFTRWQLPGPYQASISVKYGRNQNLASHYQFFSLAGSLNLILFILLFALAFRLIRLLLQKMKRRQNLRP